MEYAVFEKCVIHEDNHLLVVNKPNNILVQGDNTGDNTLLDYAKSYLKIKYQKPGNVFIGLVHRLDRPVSGVLILAKTSKGLSRLNEQMRAKQMQKTYLAISRNRSLSKSGKLTNYLYKDTSRNQVKIVSKGVNGSKEAITDYELIGNSHSTYLYRLHPITGRSHQLRVHMKSIDCSILGDLKYGDIKALADQSIALHCHKMTIKHPTTKDTLEFTASTPASPHWKKMNKLINNI